MNAKDIDYAKKVAGTMVRRFNLNINEGDEVKQLAMIGVWKARQTWNSALSSWPTWRYTCARREIIGAFRKEKTQWSKKDNKYIKAEHCEFDEEQLLPRGERFDDKVNNHFDAQKIYNKMRKVCSNQEFNVIDKYISGGTMQEAGDAVGISKCWAVRVYARGISRMQRIYGVV